MPFPVLYLAEEKLTSFWECFGDELNDQPEDDKALYEKTQLGPRQWVRFNLQPSLRVIDVTNVVTLRQLGADASTFLAEYVVTQQWAHALMAHSAKLDGFYYGSRLDRGKRCLAVFGRPSLQATPLRLRARTSGTLLEDLEFLAFLAKRGVSII